MNNCSLFLLQVYDQKTSAPVNLLQSRIQVSYKDGKTQLETDFGLHVVLGGNSTVLVALTPDYRGRVYGLCGDFNGDHQDDMAVTTPNSAPINTSLELAKAYQLFDGDLNCCTGCRQELGEVTFPAGFDATLAASHRRQCGVLMDKNGPFADCHRRVGPVSFYESCLSDLMHNGGFKSALKQAMLSYSTVCEASRDGYNERAIGK